MRFHKMQGAGNDFIVLNNMELQFPRERLSALAVHLCRRRLSIGANGLMAVDRPERDGDFQMRFFNADGSVAEMCGNGARCIARYAYEQKLAGRHMVIETAAGNVEAWRISSREYKIALNDPTQVRLSQRLEAEGRTFLCDYVELGDPGIPHVIVRLEGLAVIDEKTLWPLGNALRRHPSFSKGANVNFWDFSGNGDVLLKTFERGVEDFTLACGTGAGSAALALHRRGEVAGDRIRLIVPGGELVIELAQQEEKRQKLYLIGDTNMVAEGTVTDEDLVI